MGFRRWCSSASFWFSGKHPPPIPRHACRDDPESCVVLPEWLDGLIFKSLGGSFAPSGILQEFNLNLDSPKEKVLTYLGTYFPRSLAESYAIFRNAFSSSVWVDAFENADALTICSVGTGTGGDLVGLLLALDEIFDRSIHVSITSYEGNAIAHGVARTILDQLAQHVRLVISFDQVDQVIKESFSFISPLLCDGKDRFDFILCSKMINELITSGVMEENAYADFCHSFLPLLTARGLCLLLDVTTPIEGSHVWFPILLNGQVSHEIGIAGCGTVLPFACGESERSCDSGCYSQMCFRVRHSKRSCDVAKSCFRLVGKEPFASCLRHSFVSLPFPGMSRSEKSGPCELG